jgi:hypothetical protein
MSSRFCGVDQNNYTFGPAKQVCSGAKRDLLPAIIATECANRKQLRAAALRKRQSARGRDNSLLVCFPINAIKIEPSCGEQSN